MEKVIEHNDERDLLKMTRERVFSLPLLPQAQVLEFFHALDDCLQQSIDELLAKSNFVETYLADVVAEVAASVTHGRTIYGRMTSTRRKKGDPKPPPAPKGTPQAVFKRTSDIKFLEQSINTLRLLAYYQDRDPFLVVNEKDAARQVLAEIKFVRLVYEEVIDKFLSHTENYMEMSRRAAEAHNRMRDSKKKGDFVEAIGEWSSLHSQMQAIEEDLHVDRAYLYHLRMQVAKNQERQMKLRKTIYEPYLRIVYKEAKKHATNHIQVLDNFQNGSTGLIRAISCYNLDRNVSFSSYAHWWIRQSILFHIKDSSNFVKLPVTTWQTYTSVEKARARVLSRDGDDSIENLAEETGHSPQKLQEVYDAVRSSHVHSLDYEVDETGKMMLIDVIPDSNIEERERSEEISQDVEERLARLSPQQQWAMRLNFGMVGSLSHKGPLNPDDVMREKIRQRLAAVDVSLMP